MSYGSLIVPVSPPETVLVPADARWIRLEMIPAEDEKITHSEAATLADSLYDVNPCIDMTGEVEVPEPPAEAELKEKARQVLYSLAECEELLSGDYRREVMVVRSHLDVPYRLRLTLGTVVDSARMMPVKEEAIDVTNDSYVTLPFPVPPVEYFPDQWTVLAASWLGAVIADEGRIDPPEIRRNGNTLFWGLPVTGTLMVHWRTMYDQVTVLIPGIRDPEGRDYGERQTATLMAFYNDTVTTQLIEPPDRPDEQDWSYLSWVCGWEGADGGGADGGEEDEEDDEEPTPSVLPGQNGCVESDQRFADPDYSLEECCTGWGAGNGPCTVYRIKKQAVGISPEVLAQIEEQAQSPGAFGGWWQGGFQYDVDAIELVGHGPAPDEEDFCGWYYYRLWVPNISCCDEVAVDLYYDNENSAEIMNPGSEAFVFVVGGLGRQITWSIRGQGFYLNPQLTLRDIVTDESNGGPRWRMTVYTSAEACGTAVITVTDGCTTVQGYIRSTEGVWIEIPYQDCPLLNIEASTYLGKTGLEYDRWFFYGYAGIYRVRQEFYVSLGERYTTESNTSTDCSEICGSGDVATKTLDDAKDAAKERRINPEGYPAIISPDRIFHVVPWEIIRNRVSYSHTVHLPDEDIIIDEDAIGAYQSCFDLVDSARWCRTFAIVGAIGVPTIYGDASAPAPQVWRWSCA